MRRKNLTLYFLTCPRKTNDLNHYEMRDRRYLSTNRIPCQCASSWPHFRPPFSLRQWIVQKKVLLFVAHKWAVKRRLKRFGDRMGTACTRREIIAKGIWKGVDISSRRYYCPRVLTYCTRNWISLSFWIPHTWWRQCWTRPRSGLSLSTERYIRLVRIQQINCRS